MVHQISNFMLKESYESLHIILHTPNEVDKGIGI